MQSKEGKEAGAKRNPPSLPIRRKVGEDITHGHSAKASKSPIVFYGSKGIKPGNLLSCFSFTLPDPTSPPSPFPVIECSRKARDLEWT